VRQESAHAVIVNDFACYWSRLTNENALRAVLRQVHPGYPTSVFGLAPPVPPLTPLQVLTPTDIEAIVRTVRALLVGV
jgi:hypothetical protein